MSDAKRGKPELERLLCESRDTWAAWLAESHASSPGVWLQFAKKGSGKLSVTHAEALELALRYGWIDGQTAKLDDDYFLQRFTPRSPRSRWSRINREAATRLHERGELEPAGIAQVERAMADGRWAAAYEPASTATVPDDLRRALDGNPEARAFFTTLSSQNRYAILYRIQDAKKPETRARRIEQFVAMLAEGKTVHP
jgi:uncharacterized protein YdeI (YjbR/CyaY-like superfamily)